MVSGGSEPVVALDTKVVVALACQFALSGSTLKQSLGQRDAGRNAVLEHLFDGQVLILVDILQILPVQSGLSPYVHHAHQQQTYKVSSSHAFPNYNYKISHKCMNLRNT